MAKILLLDDDRDLTEVISAWLASENHTLEIVHDGRDGMDRLRVSDFDLVLLDWNLPGLSGLEILRYLRGEGNNTPVIMLSVNRTIDEKITGLDIGADDYLPKPFNMKELSARIRSALRRSSQKPSNVLQIRDIVLDPVKHKVYRNERPIILQPREFALLEFFLRNPDEVFSGETLLQRVWHSESEATIEAIRTCVKRIRDKLDDESSTSIIETIARVGYRLNSID
jgi:DNA-binding response OmpR family regulator